MLLKTRLIGSRAALNEDGDVSFQVGPLSDDVIVEFYHAGGQRWIACDRSHYRVNKQGWTSGVQMDLMVSGVSCRSIGKWREGHTPLVKVGETCSTQEPLTFTIE